MYISGIYVKLLIRVMNLFRLFVFMMLMLMYKVIIVVCRLFFFYLIVVFFLFDVCFLNKVVLMICIVGNSWMGLLVNIVSEYKNCIVLISVEF